MKLDLLTITYVIGKDNLGIASESGVVLSKRPQENRLWGVKLESAISVNIVLLPPLEKAKSFGKQPQRCGKPQKMQKSLVKAMKETKQYLHKQSYCI